ncbi:MAG: T9SS type A sorting domain-containing protein [Bacteroidales bacterium]|jgi:hypothetical protein|nr:T9SS type A sorting domain-containing protein [Bacteroidales bacterium]
MNRHFTKIITALFFVSLLYGSLIAQPTQIQVNEFATRMGILPGDIVPIAEDNTLNMDYHYTQNTTIEGPYILLPQKNIIVDAGVVLTFRNLTIGAFPDFYISIQAGGQLILDSVIFTNLNGLLSTADRWMGIFVGGNEKSDYYEDQGLVVITNSLIENANAAISTYYVENEVAHIGSMGGRVRATRTSFTNNLSDLHLLDHMRNLWSHIFIMCNFSITQNISYGKPFCANLYNVTASFQGCHFNNILAANGSSVGIDSFDSDLRIIDYCYQSTYQQIYPCPDSCRIRSSFTHFHHAISVDGGGIVSIRNSDFVQNKLGGVRIHNVNYLAFNGCDIETGSAYQSHGLYLRNCKYYKVENNNFTDSQNVSTGIGIYVANSGAGAHKIYRNNFDGLLIGIAPLGNNSGTANLVDGLKMNCNHFSGCNYDIAMMHDINRVQGALTVAREQGYRDENNNPKNFVRNKYGAACGMQNRWYIDSGATKEIIHACHAGTDYAPTPQPQCSNPLVKISQQAIAYNYALHCPDEVNTGIQITTLIAEMEEAIDNLQNGPGAIDTAALNYYTFELHSLIAEQIREYLELDTEEGREDALDLIAEYGFDNTLANVMASIDGGGYHKAQVLISQLEQDSSYYDYCQRRNLKIQFNQALAGNSGAGSKELIDGASMATVLLDQIRNYALTDYKPLPEINLLKDLEYQEKQTMKAETFKVYPVPAQETITFEYWTDEAESVIVELQNVAGQIVDQFELRSSRHQYAASKLERGVYLAILKVNGKKVATEKVIILK